MENNKQSLYTKYRPKNFDQVVGQKVAKDILINSIEKNMINHAYLFYGIRGTGKTTLARIFAKSINCTNPINTNPCNECEICTSINNESSFDVIEIDAASNNGVSEIRAIKENTSFLTTQTKYKVYIIDEVHMLSKAAFNALLKTLEEPPRNTIFLLATTELHKIPQTVLSRTIVINLEVMSNNDIKDGLKNVLKGENINYEENALDYITLTSGGSLRDAISALETSLLYNGEFNVNNVISALGLVKKEQVKEQIQGNLSLFLKEIDDNSKDPKKLALVILEVLMELIESNPQYVNVVNSILEAQNTIKDPLLLRIALKTAFYSINVPRETLIENTVVSRETSQNNTTLKSEIVENVENTNQSTQNSDITNRNTTQQNVENQVDNSNVNVENKIDPNALNVITEFANVDNYMYLIKRNDSEELNKVITRWKLKDTYVTRKEYKTILPTLIATEPLAASNKTIIVGFKDEEVINGFKRISLTPLYFQFIKELVGEYKFILPINEENWNKLLSAKDKIHLEDKHQDLKIKFSDFISEEDSTYNKALDIFGKDNLVNE